MSSPNRSSSTSSESAENARKRVCKACDRCRLKKSKCDGSSPCSRCKVDNAICVFGERKKSHDKVYPKGYVEMLEQQQAQLVTGLRELYRRLQSGENWPGPALKESHGGHPLTHDILERLDLLHSPPDSPMKYEGFEEDLPHLQQHLLLQNGSSHSRKRSASEESEPSMTSSASSRDTLSPKSTSFSDSFSHKRRSVTPSQDTSFLQSIQVTGATKSQQYAVPTMISANAIDPVQLQQSQQWLSQQAPLEQVDLDFTYASTIPFDTQFLDPYSEPLFYPDSFDDFVQPSMLQT